MRYRKVPGIDRPSDECSTFTASTNAPDGHLWLLIHGWGVWEYDGTRMTRYAVLHKREPVWASSIYHDRHGVTWVGTNEHGVYRFNGAEFEPWRP